MSGVAIATSKSVKPPSTLLGELLGADVVGSGLLGLARLVALREHGDGHLLAEPVRHRDRAAQLLLGVTDVQAGADVHLDGLVELGRLEVLEDPDRLGGLVGVLAIDLGQIRAIALAVLGHQPVTSTPIERAVPSMILRSLVHVVRVQVGHLLLGDLTHLRLGDRADLVAVRLARALLEPDRLLDQHRGRRRLRDEGERAVLVDRDLDRDDRAGVLLGLGVERLAELHDVHAVLAQRGADRRCRVGLAAGHLELDEGEDLAGHL